MSIAGTKMSAKKKRKCCKCCCCCVRAEPETDDEDNACADGTLVMTSNVDSPRSANTFLSKEHDYQKDKRKCDRCIRCFKKTTTFFFSNIGLCALVVAYSILGGFIFQKLEAENELSKKHSVINRRRYYVAKLWDMTLEYNILYEVNWSMSADEILATFQQEIFNATKLHGWDGNDGEDEQMWSYAGSLLYAVTVITTIGYGHIAPKTPEGRLVTIFYALVGIPMTLLYLANMGSFLAMWFRLLYKQTCKLFTWLCCPPKERHRKKLKKFDHSEELDPLKTPENKGGKHAPDSEMVVVIDDPVQAHVKENRKERIRVPIFVSLMIIATYIFGGALLFSMWEDWDYLVGSYFCFITLSTIGFGDFVPGSIAHTDYSNNQKLIICCFYLMFGLSIIAMCFSLMQEEVRAKVRWLAIKIGILDS